MKDAEILWLTKPEEHNYPAAQSYLSLIEDEPTAKRLVGMLRRAPVSHFKAKDIFRASGLSLLGVSNSHVKKDRRKIKNGKELSPLCCACAISPCCRTCCSGRGSTSAA